VSSVLITGTSKGIGYETALAFARAGHRVFATMRNPSQSDLGQAAARENLPITVSTLDVDSDESVKEAVNAILTEHGAIDVLINNAGTETHGSIEETPMSAFRAVMETNYFGSIRVIQAVVGQMRKRRSGLIVNISSVAGRIACAPLTPYMASKWALEALSEGLAGELKTFNVRVAIVEPGIIDTLLARQVITTPEGSPYRQAERFANLFATSLQNPVPPSLVAQKILEIAESGTWQLRHPAGPDAAGFLGWRAAMGDEEWVELNAADDQTWYGRLNHDFGMNLGVKATVG
jgi:NAD(P)-dependent dehydrogenase (short-subunit alcohol dehydrogenase family)